MKLKAVITFLFFYAVAAVASTSNATATLTDLDGTVWANCAFTATLTLIGGTGTPAPTIGGITVSPLTVQGVCDASGAIAATLTDTSSLDQKNGQWVFTVQPNASAPPATVSIPVVGASPDLTNSFSLLPAPRFPVGSASYGYNDGEVTNPLLSGTYYNVTTPCLRQFSLLGWTCGGGGGSSGFPITLGSTSIASGSHTTAVAGLEVNGVTLSTAGPDTQFLDKTGNYSTPASSPSCINTGVWSNTTAYTLCQFTVDNSGNIYQALVNVPAGTLLTNDTYWQKFPGNDNISSNDPGQMAVYQGANSPTVGPANVHYNNTLNYFYGLNGLMGPAVAPTGTCPVNGVTTIAQDNTVTTCIANTQVPFTGAGSGIASIAWTVPSFMTASPTTINASGAQTFSFNNQNANTVFAGPASGSSGAVGPRLLVTADIPALPFSDITGTVDPSQLPAATTTALGAVIPDNTSIAIDGTTHKISVIGGGSLPSFCNTITASTLTCTNFTATNAMTTSSLSSVVINNSNEAISSSFIANSATTLRYIFGTDASGTGFDSNDGSSTDTVINAAVAGAGYTSTFTATGFTSLSFGIRGGAAGVTCTGGVAESVLGIVTACGSSSLPTATASGQAPISTGAGTTYTAQAVATPASVAAQIAAAQTILSFTGVTFTPTVLAASCQTVTTSVTGAVVGSVGPAGSGDGSNWYPYEVHARVATADVISIDICGTGTPTFTTLSGSVSQ